MKFLSNFEKAMKQLRLLIGLSKYFFSSSIIALLIVGLYCCQRSVEKREQDSGHEQHEMDSTNVEVAKNYAISVQEIDSTAFQALGSKQTSQKKIRKITKLDEAIKCLKNVVEFSQNDEDNENGAVLSIHLRNGKEIENSRDFYEIYFVAYYPEEDILLCEAGHAADLTYNLKTGQMTEETGVPDLFRPSPKGEFRLNGFFEGQNCYSYFIQQKQQGRYQKIIAFSEAFQKARAVVLCEIGECRWIDERHFVLSELGNYVNGVQVKKYFKIGIHENN